MAKPDGKLALSNLDSAVWVFLQTGREGSGKETYEFSLEALILKIELMRTPDKLAIDAIVWSQTISLARGFAWRPSPALSRLLARGVKLGVEIEVCDDDAEALANVLRGAFRPQRMSHRRLVLWGVIGLYAMETTGKFDGSEQRQIISFCEGGSFLLRRPALRTTV